jgi:dienelactone hydrolase
MSKTLVAAALVVLSFVQADAKAQVARIEFHPFTSATLSDQEILTGKEGRPVTLAGELRIPRAGSDKLPAVILLHGRSGVGGTGWMPDLWAPELNKLGIATFTVDSLSGRGRATAAEMGRYFMVVDAYRALELLAKHPRIDHSRIAVMGFSRGAAGALYSSLRRFQKVYGPPADLQFAAHIPFYPFCVITLRGDEDVGDRPIRIHHGSADDSTPIAPCKAYMDRLGRAGRDARLIEYPGAHHVFDAPFFKTAVIRAGDRFPRRCQLTEGDDGQIVNRDTQKPFSMADACVEKGSTLAYDEDASLRARENVREFLIQTFGMKQN